MSSLRRNEEKFARLLERLAANDPTLTYVDLDGWGLGDEGAMRLVVALHVNTVLIILFLENNGISAALMSALVGALENNTSLKTLDLSRNSIGVEGGRASARLLRNSVSVTNLFLRDCGIGDAGARDLAEALPNNSSLNMLFLKGNSIGDVGASALAGSLPGNSTLTVLRLSDNEISDVGVREMAEAIPSNSSLVTLDLDENHISDVGGRLFATALLVNCTVATVNLKGNTISEPLEGLMKKLTQINADTPNPEKAHRLKVVCKVGWLVSSGVDGEKEVAVTLALDQLEQFMQADQRRDLFGRLLGSTEYGAAVAESVDDTTARTLYCYATQCGAALGVLMNLLRAHEPLYTCKDVKHGLYPFMLLATMVEAGVGDVMEALQKDPTLVSSGIYEPGDDCSGNDNKSEKLQGRT